ncbi:hypothetical protein RND81_12G008000 [Saponaria officinalis]|uniref:Replication protein A 70 kDa DNA-binding subunit B/D first OB fold domain-containing protein n=1 Tax=Saponaria officinalis TaxID=3572 RepID=A0AAW1H4A3_SAPOF
MERLSLSQLRPDVRNKEIVVRVIQKWKRVSQKEPIQLYGMKMILLDEEEQLIQASIYKTLVSKYDKEIKEGHVYKFSKFKTGPNYGIEKVTTHPCRLFIEFSSKVEQHRELPIPLYAFRFTTFDDIIHGNVISDQYFDVIGEFSEYYNIVESKEGYRRTKIDLIDAENQKMTCAVWNTYCDDITNIVTNYAKAEERPILIIQCVTINYYEGDVSIQTSRGRTKFYVNLEIHEVAEFKARRSVARADAEGSLRLTGATSDENGELPSCKLKSLQEIKTCDKAGEFITVVTIIELDSNVLWYYNLCTAC